MKISRDRNMIVYYYIDLNDLMTEEKLFNDLQIRLDYIGENTPVRVCPRGAENHILLWNSGDKTEDLKRLNINLSKLRMEFSGEL